VSLSVDADAHLDRTRQAVRIAVSDDIEPDVEIVLSGPTIPRSQRRSRFDSISVDYPGRDRVTARVDLEWDGQPWIGNAEGVMNAASELRVCASATLRAVETLVDGRGTFTGR